MDHFAYREPDTLYNIGPFQIQLCIDSCAAVTIQANNGNSNAWIFQNPE